ncbi:hypothetical protein MMC21_007413 [Puttea exsequens]|nr:hypothetical protein [Puttea exsequens]
MDEPNHQSISNETRDSSIAMNEPTLQSSKNDFQFTFQCEVPQLRGVATADLTTDNAVLHSNFKLPTAGSEQRSLPDFHDLFTSVEPRSVSSLIPLKQSNPSVRTPKERTGVRGVRVHIPHLRIPEQLILRSRRSSTGGSTTRRQRHQQQIHATENYDANQFLPLRTDAQVARTLSISSKRKAIVGIASSYHGQLAKDQSSLDSQLISHEHQDRSCDDDDRQRKTSASTHTKNSRSWASGFPSSKAPARESSSGSDGDILEIHKNQSPEPATSPATAGAPGPLPATPNFKPYQEAISTTKVTQAVFRQMKASLKGSSELVDGYIYILRFKDHPGCVKIGQTTNPIETRCKQINKCVNAELEAFNDSDFCSVPNHARVEKLIHLELRNYRRKFQCHSPICNRGHQAKDHNVNLKEDGFTQHGEWFEIPEKKAVEVVERWRTWISTKPYSGITLRPTEQLRIDYYSKSKQRMDEMVTSYEGKEHWRWEDFMAFSLYMSFVLAVRVMLFEQRPVVSKGPCSRCLRSRWDSVVSHWHWNILYYAGVFVFSALSLSTAALFGTRMTWILMMSFMNTTILGSSAVLYAA